MSFQQQPQQSTTTSGKFKEGTRGLREGASNVAKSPQVQGLTNAAKDAGKSLLSVFGLGKEKQPTGQPAMGPAMGSAMGGKRRRKSRKRKGRRSKKRRTKRRRKSRRSKSRRRRRR